MNHNKDFDIVKLIELVRYKKYETTVAGFAVIDKLERVSIPKKWKSRKIAIQAMYALSEGLVRYKYLTKDEKLKIAEEVTKRSQTLPSNRAQNLFAPANAPLSSEETEEEELPSEETSFHPDYVDDRYNADSMQEETDDYEYEDEDEEEE